MYARTIIPMTTTTYVASRRAARYPLYLLDRDVDGKVVVRDQLIVRRLDVDHRELIPADGEEYQDYRGDQPGVAEPPRRARRSYQVPLDFNRDPHAEQHRKRNSIPS